MGTINLRLRIRILERDGYRCVYCGKTAKDGMLQLDHVVPRSRGGSNDPTNLVTACFECNNGKRADDLRLPDYVSPQRCPGERHSPPYSLHPIGPPEAPGRDTALVCNACHHIIGMLSSTDGRHDVGVAS